MKKHYTLLLLLFSLTLFSQNNVSVQIQSPFPICNIGECTTLTANYTQINNTSDYAVQSISYQPLYPFSYGTQVNFAADDRWSPTFTLPFTFCFYGINYNEILIGTNGLIHFIDGSQTSSGNCPWNFSTTIPNTSFPIKNSIYGVYQDTDISSSVVTNPSVQNVNYYVFGTAPNRKVIINFNQLPLYNAVCNNLLQTSQVILYETSNVIDVNIVNRTPCSTWNSGNGVLGIQNQNGTLAAVPTGRNTGDWSANNEAWRFIPSGSSTSQISWYANNTLIPSSVGQNTISVCPDSNTTYTAEIIYSSSCSGLDITIMDSIIVGPEPFVLTNEPLHLFSCTTTFDINQDSYMLAGLNPAEYSISYFTSLIDAQNYMNEIPPSMLSNYSSTGETIYVRVEDYFTTGCIQYTNFDLIIQGAPSVPTTLWSTQIYTDDNTTVADLQINETNITWYDAAINGNILPATTLLMDGTTYYASQTDTFCGFESTDRLAITVHKIANSSQMLNPGSTVGDLIVTPLANSTVLWYLTETGGLSLNATDVLSDGIYFVEQITTTPSVPNTTNATYISNRAAVNVDVTTLSSNTFNNKKFNIYPNPTQDRFKISDLEVGVIKVFDNVGKLILEVDVLNNEQIIDLSSYDAGFYFVEITSINRKQILKLIKE